MKEDTKDALIIIGAFIGITLFTVIAIAAVIGIPAYAIIEIIKVIKE